MQGLHAWAHVPGAFRYQLRWKDSSFGSSWVRLRLPHRPVRRPRGAWAAESADADHAETPAKAYEDVSGFGAPSYGLCWETGGGDRNRKMYTEAAAKNLPKGAGVECVGILGAPATVGPRFQSGESL